MLCAGVHLQVADEACARLGSAADQVSVGTLRYAAEAKLQKGSHSCPPPFPQIPRGALGAGQATFYVKG